MEMKELRWRTLAKLIGDMRTKDFAEQHDLDASYLSQILNGHRGMGEKAARKMEIKIGLPDGTLVNPSQEGLGAEGNTNQGKESNVISADFSKKDLQRGELSIPQYDVRGAMGSGQLPNDYVEIIRHVTMHKSHLDLLGISYTSPANLAIITGWGQSMAGTINHGEPVFVDRGITSFTGDGVYVFTWDNLVYIKRLQKESKTHFKVISDNREHDPFNVEIDDVVFHARAVLAWNARKL
jgi:phage repressor protein C with HTH and peptisase S24 domain